MNARWAHDVRGDNPAESGEPAVPLDGAHLVLDVDHIHVYDQNPRTSANPAYAEIKASILAQGNNHRFTVTMRPGDPRFFTYAGGNTRLRILQELWHTTADPRWKTVDAVFRTWTTESAVLAAHFAENNSRGDPSYWDNATAIHKLRAMLEAEKGLPLTTPQLAEALRPLGIDLGLKALQTMAYAADRLAPIGPWLRPEVVTRQLAPAHRSLVALAEVFAVPQHRTDAAIQDSLALVRAMLQTHSRTEPSPDDLDPEAVIAHWHQAIANLLPTTPATTAAQVRAMLAARAADSRLNADALRTISAQPSLPLGFPTSRRVPAGSKGNPRTHSAPSGATTPSGQPAPESAVMATTSTPAEASPSPTAPHAAELLNSIIDTARTLCDMAGVPESVTPAPAMPLGFVLRALHYPQPRPALPMTRAAWMLLACATSQFDARLTHCLPSEACDPSTHDPATAVTWLASDLAEIARQAHAAIAHPTLGPVLTQAFALAHRLQTLMPQRFHILPEAIHS